MTNAKIDSAEFDNYAEHYYEQHSKNISISGESPGFFSEYKIKDVYARLKDLNMSNKTILDFGCGIGNSIPYIKKYFIESKCFFADVSEKSINIAQERYPEAKEDFLLIQQDSIPLPDNSVDVVFTACVFHHIDPIQHDYWLRELKRIIKPTGSLFVFEHNPYNPFTVRAVNTCPFDINAKIISAPNLRGKLMAAGWGDTSVYYRLFFPAILAKLRFLESYMHRIPLGAQYYIHAVK